METMAHLNKTGEILAGCPVFMYEETTHAIYCMLNDSKLKIVLPFRGDIGKPVRTMLVANKNTDWRFLYWQGPI